MLETVYYLRNRASIRYQQRSKSLAPRSEPIRAHGAEGMGTVLIR
ncbi:hypothetical protein OH492_24995 [Vibrio chagasii]|nr:hypothetical protein [Vibrio chagasii]